MSDTQILFVDDDREILVMVEQYLTMKGYAVTTVDNGRQAVEIIKSKTIDIVFTDYKMPEFNGLELLAAIKKHRPRTEVVMVTGYGSMESAIEAMKFGSRDYLQKPFKLDHLKLIIDRIVEEKKIADKAQWIRTAARKRHRYGRLIGLCPRMLEVYELVDTVSLDSAVVLIRGESGTGKALTARTIHEKSQRRTQPFVALNCSSLGQADQTRDQIGILLSEKLRSVGGGTLYLEEVGALGSADRRQLTDLLGSPDIISGQGPRLIAGTSGDLDDLIAGGAMKRDALDLFNAVLIKLPPLRERQADIALLVNHFLYQPPPAAKTRIYGISPPALEILLQYHWPGNLIELQNVIERAFAMGVANTIGPEDLPEDLRTFDAIHQMS